MDAHKQKVPESGTTADRSDSGTLPTTVTDTALKEAHKHDPFYVWKIANFRFLFLGAFLATIGEQMQAVAIGWELYDRTGSALILGGVGLVLVLPVILFSLPGGQLADRANRKHIVMVTQAIIALSSLGLAVLSYTQGQIWMIYGCLLLIGCAAAFNSPALGALLPQALPEDAFENAAKWESTSWQLASMFGPAAGGAIIALWHSAMPVYLINAITALGFTLLLLLITTRPIQRSEQEKERPSLRSLTEGIRFLRGDRVLLAAITLDLFAVLLGGATTLMPIFAKDILHVGPVGLGWLQAAPSIGAVSMALLLALRPALRKAGRTLLLAVAAFGIATIIFGLSRSFWLSLLMLFFLGSFDNVSVVIRHTLLLTRTPDTMRGRISAVNSLFIASSNQLGGFESGLAAQLFGPVLAVAGGGVGTVLVVVCVALLWPEMRKLETMTGSK